MTENNNTNNFCKYSKEKVIEGIKLALKLFMYKDSNLIKCDLHEMAITHRLAVYLGYVFSDYDVDCEWNKKFGEKSENNIKKMSKNITIKSPDIRQIDLFYKINDYIKEKKSKCCDNDHKSNEAIEISVEHDCIKIESKQVRPDIIIHQRKTSRKNLVVIEIKKESRCIHKNECTVEKYYDLIKLHAMTTQEEFNYSYGFFIQLPEDVVEKKMCCEESENLKVLTPNETIKVFEIKFIDKD